MSICINCGKEGLHFVPPSMGDPGFFACDAFREDGDKAMSTEKQETKGKWELQRESTIESVLLLDGAIVGRLKHPFAQQILDKLNAKSEWIRVEERAFDDMGKIVLLIGRNVRNPMVGYFTNHADGPEFFDANGYELDCEITHYMRPLELPNDGGGK